ncbi:MarR family transcriptional regulator [Thalassomonas viridans]|uniref:MarR family transcriptional regulator n=1 Tax=Thalassomonas viridans TaxID=137584 RepID=A0AAF0CAG1_9GAMM|nr:MarR family transcriptional regulator [Thalassomonas viridans]WDE06270.1 MarR family transcriptional regulator [Thalassomonas viridans]
MPEPKIHEVAFRLAFDVKNCLSDTIECVGSGLAPMHMRALRVVWKKQQATALDIAQTLKRDKAQITRLINTLLQDEFVSRIPNPNDKRSQLLMLTDKGKGIFARIEAAEALLATEMTRDITAEDLAIFFKVADQLSDNMMKMS